MKIKICLVLLSTVISSHISYAYLYSDETQQKPSRQAAMEAFSGGDYEKAYREFNILLQKFSRDPLYKYYSGVCLIKLNREPGNASTYLLDALNGSLDIKNIPVDAWFFLGRSQQMSGKYADAIKSYELFTDKTGNRNARTYNVDQFIQECNEGRGQLKESDFKQPEIAARTVNEIKPAETKIGKDKPENPQTAKPAPQRQSLPAEYDKLLSEAMRYQVKADSLNALSAGYRNNYSSLPASQKPAAKSRISETESLAASYQKLADEKFTRAGFRPEAGKDSVVTQTETVKLLKPVQNTDTKPEEATKTVKKQDQTQLPVRKSPVEVFSLFQVETNPELIKNQKISIDPELPAGLVYRIQMGVFSKPLSPGFFKGISPASGFRISGTASTRYFVGMFRRIADANRSLMTVKQMGFKDSFVTAILDGKPVSVERAALLENEWGQKPLMITDTAPSAKTVEEGPSTLVFRVEVARVAKPAGKEVEEAYKKLAGTRGLDIFSTPEGSTAYIIGKFITFESASEYADLLVRNGYRDARVVAYLGPREVPVETAKELFEKIK